MPAWRVTHICGHTDTTALGGTTDAQRRWAAQQRAELCDECKAAASLGFTVTTRPPRHRTGHATIQPFRLRHLREHHRRARRHY